MSVTVGEECVLGEDSPRGTSFSYSHYAWIKKRSANITNKQRTLLIEYMNNHPELIKEKFTPSFTLKNSVALWTELTEILNSVNGAKKDWKNWRKCWHDFRFRSKGKYALVKQSMRTIGGGTNTSEELTP